LIPPNRALYSLNLDRADARNWDSLLPLTVEELASWANDEDLRTRSEGRMIIVKGQYQQSRKSNLAFLLSRLKTTEPGEILPPILVLCDESVTGIEFGQWIQVTGQVEYRKRNDQVEFYPILKEYYPVLRVRSRQDIVPTERASAPLSLD
jgi:hypothetical protein